MANFKIGDRVVYRGVLGTIVKKGILWHVQLDEQVMVGFGTLKLVKLPSWQLHLAPKTESVSD